MHANARVLLYSDTDNSGELAGKLEKPGFQPLPATSHEDALRIVDREYPDIAIVNATTGDDAGRLRQELLALRPEGGIPTIVIGAGAETPEDNLQTEYLPAPFRDAELFSRLQVLSRLVTMQAELDLRSETSELYGVDAPAHVAPPSTVAGARILVICKNADLQRSIAKIIAPFATSDNVEDPFDAIEKLLQAPFDAVVAVRTDEVDGLLDFCRVLRNHANLFNMPLAILSDSNDTAAHDQAYEAGASDVLDLDSEMARLSPRLQHLVKQQRYRQSMQDVYREGRHYAATESLTGLFGHGYLHVHLQKQIAESQSRHKDLALGFFDIADMTAFNAEYGYVAGDMLLRQIGSAFGGLVRAEDLPARFGGDKFCIVLPDTDLASARPVLQRIAGVINFTEFAVTNAGEPVKVRLKNGSAQLQDDDTAESLIARARANIEGT